MHTLNRIITSLMFLALLLPPATFALVSLDEKNAAEQRLQQAIGTAVASYRQRGGVQTMKTKGEQQVATQQSRIAALGAKKRELRLAVAKQKRIIASVGEKYGIVLTSKAQLQPLIEIGKKRLLTLVKNRYLSMGIDTDISTRDMIVNAMLHGAASASRTQNIEESQRRVLRDLMAAAKSFDALDTLVPQYEATLKDFRDAENKYDSAQKLVERSSEELDEIQRITAEVHDQVLKMQGELARIDARLKEKAQRTLIEKGLLDPSAAQQQTVFRPQFTWPIYGGMSAGFLNADYKKHFGVPHYGQDIAAAQGTPVSAAADGVVFLVRDGGQKGYSYILIGHRGGYATLYGHVSEALVKAGDDVTAGQAIALSGGTPGMHGSGPMTTGPHLHFEVIKAGVNIDPLSVLP